MYSFRKILLVTIGVISLSVFAFCSLALSAQQSSSSQLLTVAVLPFESDKNKDDYRFIGWGLHYLISSRLQNVPGIYCLSAEEVINIYPSTIEKKSKVGEKETNNGVLEIIQENLSDDNKRMDIYNTLNVDTLIYGEYDHQKNSFEIWAHGKKEPDEIEFKGALADANVFAVLIDRIIKLLQSVSNKHNDAFYQYCKTLNKENPIFAHLPDYQASMLFKVNEEKYKQFRVYSESWKDLVTAIRDNNKCDTFEKKWKAEGEEKFGLTREVDGKVLDAHIHLHNKQLNILPRGYEIQQFEYALQKIQNLVAAQLGQIKTWWHMGKLGPMHDLIETVKKTRTPPGSLNPWFDIYEIAFELAANDQWEQKNLKAMENIANRVPWLTTGFESKDKSRFDSNREWAAATMAKLLGERGRILFMENVLNDNVPEDSKLNSIVLSFLYAEMHMRKGEYIVAYRNYKRAHSLFKEQDENNINKRRHLTYFSPRLLDPDFLENKVKQCRHILYKIRLPGSGTFLKFYKHPEIITAIAQNPKNRLIYAGTNRLNVYRLMSHRDNFEKAIIKREDFLANYARETDEIESLQFDQSGKLWITTTQSGLFLWNGHSLHKGYICASPTSQNRKKLKGISAFLVDDAQNIIWISPSAGTIERCSFDEKDICLECKPTNIKSDVLGYKALLKDSSNRIYTAIDNIIYLYDDRQNKFVELVNSNDHFKGQPIIKAAIYPNEPGEHNAKLWIITEMTADPSDKSNIASYNQWLATVNQNLVTEKPTFKGLLTPPSGPAKEGFRIEKILPDSHGGLWIGTQREGLLNVKDNAIFDYNDFFFEGEDVNDLLWDKGLLWIASKRGVRRLNFDTVMTYFDKDGLPGNMVYAIAGSKDGDVYIGTSSGLAVYRNGIFEKIDIKEKKRTKNRKETQRTKTRGIYGLLYDSETGLWCRGENWLQHYPINDGIHAENGHPYILEDYFTRNKDEIKVEIVADKARGGIWTNTFQGLCFVRHNSQKNRLYLNLPKPPLRPTTPVIDTDQSIWFARKNNLYHIKKEDIERLLEEPFNNEKIEGILEKSRIEINENILSNAFSNRKIPNHYVYMIRLQTSRDSKRIWLGTSTGVIEFNPKTNEFKLQNKQLGLGDTPVMVMALGLAGKSLWIGTNHGLLRYHFSHQQSSLYDYQYGLQSNTVRSLGFFEKDRVWVGTDNGLATFRLRPVAPLFLDYKLKDLGEKDGGDVEIELTPVFYHGSHGNLRYLVSSKKLGAEFIVSPSQGPQSNHTGEKPEFRLSDNRLFMKGLSPGNYDISIKALSPEFQETPKDFALRRQFKIIFPFFMQPWFFALIGLLVLLLSLVFYLNTQHARKRFGSRWSAITYSRKMRKSQAEFIFLIYSIFQKSDAPEKLLEFIRTKTAAGKNKNLAGLIQNYLYLLKLPKTMYNLSRLLKSAKDMKWSQDISRLYHIISEMQNKDSMADIAGLQLTLDANRYRLESSVCDRVDIPEFISIDIIKQLVLLDKTLSILAQVKSGSDYKYQWYYLTAADRILRDILAGSFQAANCPERNVIISITKQYSGIVKKEMNRVIADESKLKDDITDQHIIRHIVENEYPSPIAYLYSRAQKEDNPVIKADYELDLLGLLVRLLAYLVITDYVSIPQMAERIDLSNLAQKPFSDGAWNGIFRDIVAALATDQQNQSIPEIYEEFSQKQSIQQLGNLIKLRNDIIHRRRRDIETITDFNEALTHLLEKLHFFKDLDLLIVRKVSADEGPFKHVEFLKARGDSLKLSTIKVTTGISLSEHHIVVHNPLQSRIIDLYPFLRYEACSLCKEHHIFYFSDVSGNRARYLSANTDCINQSKAYQNYLAEYLNPASEVNVKAWIKYHVFKEEKKLYQE